MKRSPLKRKTPLRRTAMKRNSTMRPRPMSSDTQKPSGNPQTKSKKRNRPKRKTKYARRERDFDYMRWVKTQPCLLAGVEGAGPCTGVVEADHAGDRGFGQKAPDDTCIPLCTGHHRDRHACTGFFRGRAKEWKREWRHAAIEKTRANYLPTEETYGY